MWFPCRSVAEVLKIDHEPGSSEERSRVNPTLYDVLLSPLSFSSLPCLSSVTVVVLSSLFFGTVFGRFGLGGTWERVPGVGLG